MAGVTFGIVSLVAAIAAVLVVTRRNPIYSALFLVTLFGCIAAQFFLLGAEFLGFMQLLVYAGAIMVLYLFVIMLINPREDSLPDEGGALDKGIAAGVAVLVFGFLFTAIQGAQLYDLKRQLPIAQEETAAFEQERGRIATMSLEELMAAYDISDVSQDVGAARRTSLAREEAVQIAESAYRTKVCDKTIGFSKLDDARAVSAERLAALPPDSPEYVWANHGETESFGRTLFSRFLFEFELTSVLILISIVGAVHLSLRAKRGTKKPTSGSTADSQRMEAAGV